MYGDFWRGLSGMFLLFSRLSFSLATHFSMGHPSTLSGMKQINDGRTVWFLETTNPKNRSHNGGLGGREGLREGLYSFHQTKAPITWSSLQLIVTKSADF